MPSCDGQQMATRHKTMAMQVKPEVGESIGNERCFLWTDEVKELAGPIPQTIEPEFSAPHQMIAQRRRRRAPRAPPSATVQQQVGKQPVNGIAVLARLQHFLSARKMGARDLLPPEANQMHGQMRRCASAGRSKAHHLRGAAAAPAKIPIAVLRTTLLRFDMRLSPSEVSEVLSTLDPGGRGTLTLAELEHALHKARQWGARRTQFIREERATDSNGKIARQLLARGGSGSGTGRIGAHSRMCRDPKSLARERASLRARGILTVFEPAKPHGRKCDLRGRFGCGEAVGLDARPSAFGASTSVEHSLRRRGWEVPHGMRDARAAAAAEHVLLRLNTVLSAPHALPGYNKHDPATYNHAAMSAWLYGSRGGGVCDVLSPAELERRLLSPKLGLGLDTTIVRRAVGALMGSGGEHVGFREFAHALRAARRRCSTLDGRLIASDPQVLQAIRASTAPCGRDPRS